MATRHGRRQATRLLVLLGSAALMVSSCSSGSDGRRDNASGPHTSSSLPNTSTSRGSPSATSIHPVAAPGCPVSVGEVAAAIGRTVVERPVIASITHTRCRFDTVGGAEAVEVLIIPFPQHGGPRTLAAAQAATRDLLAKGTASDRATARIIAKPSWGTGAFVEATIVPVVPVMEVVDGYLGHNQIDIAISTKRLLADHELAWVDRLAADLR